MSMIATRYGAMAGDMEKKSGRAARLVHRDALAGLAVLGFALQHQQVGVGAGEDLAADGIRRLAVQAAPNPPAGLAPSSRRAAR